MVSALRSTFFDNLKFKFELSNHFKAFPEDNRTLFNENGNSIFRKETNGRSNDLKTRPFNDFVAK